MKRMQAQKEQEEMRNAILSRILSHEAKQRCIYSLIFIRIMRIENCK